MGNKQLILMVLMMILGVYIIESIKDKEQEMHNNRSNQLQRYRTLKGY